MAKKARKKSKGLVSGSQYQGKYVAITSTGKKRVVASASTVSRVVKRARELGEEVPGIVFVPEKGVACLY